MKAWAVVLLVLVAMGAGGGVGYWWGYRTGASKKEEAKAEEKPVATVAVAVIRRGTIPRQITLYGNVVAPASEVQVASVPFEARVGKVLIAPGEVVTAGQPLIEVEGSAATTLAFQEAQNAANAAQRDVQLVRQRFEQKLATNQELYTAETALQLAQGRLRSLQQGGAGGPRQLKAEAPGIVSKVDVQRGQVVTAGSPLVEVVGRDRIEVKLAAQAEDLPKLKVEQAVSLTPVENAAAAPVEGKIRLIGQRVDPTTRLVDVLVSLPPDAKLLLDASVAGKITTSESGEGLIVPRSAVEPGDNADEYTLFTVKDEKAVKHAVKVTAEGEQDVLVAAEDLKEGDAVVIEGNHELEDGMPVKTEAATTEPAETRPATTPATTEASS
jgi:membrane fusion protein (multidrug efflux system)